MCLTAGALFISCSKEPATLPVPGQRALRFEAAPQEGWNSGVKTRATPVTTEAFHSSFGVYAAMFPSTEGWTEDRHLDFMWNVEVRQSSGTIYAPENPYYLPGDGQSLRFFAYAPYGAAEVRNVAGADSDPDTWTGTPHFRFEVQADVSQQVDFCVAQSAVVPGDGDGTVQLGFYHALVGVRFVTGTVPSSGTIRNITLTDIRTGAYHQPAKDGGSALWRDYGPWNENGENHGGVKDISLPLAVRLTGAAGTAITTEEQTCMLIPGSPQSGSSIELLYDPDGVEGSGDERTLTARIGDELGAGSMGKIVTYRLSIVNDELVLASAIAPWDTTRPAVEGGAEKPLPAPKVGDFYYSDGTWSTALNAAKEVIGIVYQTDLSRIGQAEREALAAAGVAEPHGLVMALKDASTSAAWATVNTDIPDLTNSTTLKGNYNDYSGLANCNAVRELDGDFSDYPAFRAACVEFAEKVPAPAKTTGWYLPSFGQWWDIFTNISGANLSSLVSDKSNSIYFNNTDMSGRLNANASLQQIADDKKNRFETARYISSTEVSDTQYCSWAQLFVGSQALDFSRTSKNTSAYVRAVLAF